MFIFIPFNLEYPGWNIGKRDGHSFYRHVYFENEKVYRIRYVCIYGTRILLILNNCIISLTQSLRTILLETNRVCLSVKDEVCSTCFTHFFV